MNNSSPTVFALSTAPGRSAIAVVRVSGPNACHTLRRLTGTTPEQEGFLFRPRQMYHRTLLDPTTTIDPADTSSSSSGGNAIDSALVVWFPGRSSYTGEDLVEFHVHGSNAVVRQLLKVLGSLEGLRMAEPGEFTLRAFQNGKMDLVQVEGLADLLKSDTERQRKQALRQAQGNSSKLFDRWRADIIRCMALTEAEIDFGENDSLESGLMSVVSQRVRVLMDEVGTQIKRSHCGEIVRDGIRVVIVGAPNAGKSSFLNHLARRDVAIVSPIAGTTRDVLEVQLDLNGFSMTVCDTAGLRDHTTDAIEMEGIRRTKEQMRLSEFRLIIVDASELVRADVRGLFDTFGMDRDVDFVLLNKIDLLLETSTASRSDWISSMKRQIEESYRERDKRCFVWPISCRTAEGTAAFLAEFGGFVDEWFHENGGDSISTTNLRQRHHLEACVASLARFLDHCEHPEQIALAAEDLRIAANELGYVTGHVNIEEVLDEIFKNFCIGK